MPASVIMRPNRPFPILTVNGADYNFSPNYKIVIFNATYVVTLRGANISVKLYASGGGSSGYCAGPLVDGTSSFGGGGAASNTAGYLVNLDKTKAYSAKAGLGGAAASTPYTVNIGDESNFYNSTDASYILRLTGGGYGGSGTYPGIVLAGSGIQGGGGASGGNHTAGSPGGSSSGTGGGGGGGFPDHGFTLAGGAGGTGSGVQSGGDGAPEVGSDYYAGGGGGGGGALIIGGPYASYGGGGGGAGGNGAGPNSSGAGGHGILIIEMIAIL